MDYLYVVAFVALLLLRVAERFPPGSAGLVLA